MFLFSRQNSCAQTKIKTARIIVRKCLGFGVGTGKSDKEKPSIPFFSRFTRELVEFFEKSVHLFLLIFEIVSFFHQE